MANVEEVGLYTAGFYIINTYTGLVFSGMATEYYPRIASMSEDNAKVFCAVDSQSDLSIMLFAPLLCAFILLGDWAILLLYSEDFLKVKMMINLSMIGMFFKAPSWCLGYVYLGKGDSKTFFLNELIAIVYTLLLNIVFYKFWGLTGMGLSFLLSFLLYWIQNLIVCHFRYGYIFNASFLKKLIPQLLLASLCFLCASSDNLMIRYLMGGGLFVVSFILSFKVLKENIDLNILKNKLLRKKL